MIKHPNLTQIQVDVKNARYMSEQIKNKTSIIHQLKVVLLWLKLIVETQKSIASSYWLFSLLISLFSHSSIIPYFIHQNQGILRFLSQVLTLLLMGFIIITDVNISPTQTEFRIWQGCLLFMVCCSFLTASTSSQKHLAHLTQNSRYAICNRDPLFPMAITTSIVTIVFGLYNLVMYFIYVKKIPFFQQYRVCHKPWLWESNVEEWKKLIKKTFVVVILNSYILMPIGYLLQYVLIKQQYAKSMQLWPSIFTIFWQSMFFLLMEDFGFYWSHYLLHKTRLYKYHKIHHEHVMTVTIGASYAHPIQALLSNALPGVLGAVILSKFTTVHYASIAVWFVFGLVETCEAHSGYEWSWRQLSFFPWKMGPTYHSFHHETYSENIGSIFIFWDNIMKTNEKYFTRKDQKSKS